MCRSVGVKERGGVCGCQEGGYVIDAHTIRHLATLQPRVPAPSKRHLVCAMAERSRDGRRRQRISFRLRSTEDSANLERERREGSVRERKLLRQVGGSSNFNWQFIVVISIVFLV